MPFVQDDAVKKKSRGKLRGFFIYVILRGECLEESSPERKRCSGSFALSGLRMTELKGNPAENRGVFAFLRGLRMRGISGQRVSNGLKSVVFLAVFTLFSLVFALKRAI